MTMDSTKMGDAGSIQKEVILSIHGIGLSLVNTDLRQEVMYISIARYLKKHVLCNYSTRVLIGLEEERLYSIQLQHPQFWKYFETKGTAEREEVGKEFC